MGSACFFSDALYNLLAAHFAFRGQRGCSLYYSLFLFAREAIKFAGFADQARILFQEFLDGRFRKTKAFSAVFKDKLARKQTALAPAVNRLCRDIKVAGQFIYPVDFLPLSGNGLGELAAEFGYEHAEVFCQLGPCCEVVPGPAFRMETGDTKDNEVKGVLFFRFEFCQKLLGRIELLHSVLARHEPELHKQFGQFFVLYRAHDCPKNKT
jgi:hypothetical protein